MSFTTVHVSFNEWKELSKMPHYVDKRGYMGELSWLDHEQGALYIDGTYIRIIRDIEEITETVTKKTLRIIQK